MNALAGLPTPIVIWTALLPVATAKREELFDGKAMVDRSTMLEDWPSEKRTLETPVDERSLKTPVDERSPETPVDEWSLETPVNERSLESFAEEASSSET